MKRYYLLFLSCFFLAQPAGAEYQLGEHPRIFITKETLPLLAERARGSGMLAEDYAMIKAEADRVVEQGTFRRLDSRWHRPTDMLCACLAYLVERELGNENALAYAEAVKKIWGDGLLLSNQGSGHFGSYAIAYDWIYDALTEEERIRFGNYLAGWLYWYTNTPEIVLKWGGWLYNQTWGPAHLNTPNCRDGITPKLLVTLALYGAGTAYQEACQRFLDSWEKRVPSECIPLFDRIGGVWAESMGHGGYGPVNVIPWAFEAWRTATGQDWFQLGSPTSFLREMNKWAVHLTVPFNNRLAYIDDNEGDFLQREWNMVAPILGARYKDPVANYISSTFDRGIWPQDWFTIPWIRFISYDPDVPSLTPGEANWPTARLFTGAGHLYLRSRWDDPDATWAFFGAGPWYANHSRDDEGHFLIAKKGWLVARAGGQGHNDNDYYSGGSLAFNIVTIFDPEEQFNRVSPNEEQLSSGGTRNERDGGMIRLVYSGGHDQIKERGRITAYKHGSWYTYAAADLTPAYRRSKVREVTRQFLYLRDAREFFIIFDRIEATKPEYPKTWFLHIPTEPQVNGIEEVLTPGHVYSYTEANTATWLSDPAGTDEDVLSSGRARAFLKSLLPRGATITKRGGKGHDFWGHPHEPTAQYNHVGAKSYLPPVVPWRLEVEAPTGETRDYFLHVLEIGDQQQNQMCSATLVEPEDTGLVGVRLAASGMEPIEVLFSTRGTMSARVKLGEEGSFEQLPTEVDTTVNLGLKGDVNQDGRLGTGDVITLLLKGRKNPADRELDFNADGVYSLRDAIALLYSIREHASLSLVLVSSFR